MSRSSQKLVTDMDDHGKLKGEVRAIIKEALQVLVSPPSSLSPTSASLSQLFSSTQTLSCLPSLPLQEHKQDREISGYIKRKCDEKYGPTVSSC